MISIIVTNGCDRAELILGLVGEEYGHSVTSHNYDFNISTSKSAFIKESTEVIWRKAKRDQVPLHLVSDETYKCGVQKRIFSVDDARKILMFECTASLSENLKEVTPWIKPAVESGII